MSWVAEEEKRGGNSAGRWRYEVIGGLTRTKARIGARDEAQRVYHAIPSNDITGSFVRQVLVFC